MSAKKRPILKNLVLKNTSEIEKFQNETLRPIVKMQHEIIITFFKSCLLNRKIQPKELQEKELLIVINTFFNKDNKFRNQLLGVIIGHFSIEEFQFYLRYASEINRRIVQITSQRLRDSVQEIII